MHSLINNWACRYSNINDARNRDEFDGSIWLFAVNHLRQFIDVEILRPIEVSFGWLLIYWNLLHYRCYCCCCYHCHCFFFPHSNKKSEEWGKIIAGQLQLLTDNLQWCYWDFLKNVFLIDKSHVRFPMQKLHTRQRLDIFCMLKKHLQNEKRNENKGKPKSSSTW
jgi:hypothetical protein